MFFFPKVQYTPSPGGSAGGAAGIDLANTPFGQSELTDSESLVNGHRL